MNMKNGVCINISTKTLIKSDRFWLLVYLVVLCAICLLFVWVENLNIILALLALVISIFIAHQIGVGNCIPYGYKINDDGIELKCFENYVLKREIYVSKEDLVVRILKNNKQHRLIFCDRRKKNFGQIAYTQYSSSKWEPSYWSLSEITNLVNTLEQEQNNIILNGIILYANTIKI